MKILFGTILIILAASQVVRNAPFARQAAPVRGGAPVVERFAAPQFTAPQFAAPQFVAPAPAAGVWPAPTPYWGGNPWEYQ